MPDVWMIEKRVGQPPRRVDRPAGLKDLQELVGGFVEAVAVGPGVDLVCNEDAIALGLEFNCAGILGDFVILGLDEDSGAWRGLTGEEARKGLAYLARLHDLPHAGEGVTIIAGADAVSAALREDARDRQALWESL